MPRGTRKTYFKRKNTRNNKNIRKQRRTRGGVPGKRNSSIPKRNSSIPKRNSSIKHNPPPRHIVHPSQGVIPMSSIPEGDEDEDEDYVYYMIKIYNLRNAVLNTNNAAMDAASELAQLYSATSISDGQARALNENKSPSRTIAEQAEYWEKIAERKAAALQVYAASSSPELQCLAENRPETQPVAPKWCNVMGGKKTAKRRHKHRRKRSTRRRR